MSIGVLLVHTALGAGAGLPVTLLVAVLGAQLCTTLGASVLLEPLGASGRSLAFSLVDASGLPTCTASAGRVGLFHCQALFISPAALAAAAATAAHDAAAVLRAEALSVLKVCRVNGDPA